MKMKLIVNLLLLSFVFCFLPLNANAAATDINTYTPYDLTAEQMTVDETHPYGSALLTFKIKKLPGDTGDTTLTWYVGIEKKIGNGEWIEVELIPSTTMLAEHQKSSGVFTFEQLWVEDYDWDAKTKISYRVYVSLDDLVGNRGGKSKNSLEAAIGLISNTWAFEEVKSAMELGLIPNSLKGADLTKPITREEFADLAVVLYEKASGKSSEPVAVNPFKDTSNLQVLKAFNLKITYGVSNTKFEPKKLITREQCAAMLFRALKAIKPDGDFRVSGVKDFADQKHIASYHLEAVKYMASKEIIKGNSKGEFMPKATSTVQEAQGYGLATREAAIMMALRSYKLIK